VFQEILIYDRVVARGRQSGYFVEAESGRRTEVPRRLVARFNRKDRAAVSGELR
jgi:acyl-CoA thioesterase FadM